MGSDKMSSVLIAAPVQAAQVYTGVDLTSCFNTVLDFNQISLNGNSYAVSTTSCQNLVVTDSYFGSTCLVLDLLWCNDDSYRL